MKAVVLAGGLGSRLRERVPDLPKPMAPVAGRPFLEYILDRLVVAGVSELILSVGYRADIIMQHFGNAYHGVNLKYSVETEPLGTGGAIALAVGRENTEPVLVLNGDTYMDIDYKQFILWYSRMKPRVAMILREVQDTERYGSVLVSNEVVTGFEEKGKRGPGFINAGVYIVKPSVFDDFGLTGKFSFETDLLQAYCKHLLPGAFISDAYFIDIGVVSDYERAQIELPAIV